MIPNKLHEENIHTLITILFRSLTYNERESKLNNIPLLPQIRSYLDSNNIKLLDTDNMERVIHFKNNEYPSIILANVEGVHKSLLSEQIVIGLNRACIVYTNNIIKDSWLDSFMDLRIIAINVLSCFNLKAKDPMEKLYTTLPFIISLIAISCFYNINATDIVNNKEIIKLSEIKNFSKDDLNDFIEYLLSVGGSNYHSNSVQKMFNEDPNLYFYISKISSLF